MSKSNAMIGCPSDAEPFAKALRDVWYSINGTALRGETFHWRSHYDPFEKTASLPDQSKIISTADPATNPVFILFANTLGSPVRLQQRNEIDRWRERLERLVYPFVSLAGVGEFKDSAHPPEGTIPLTGTLYELLEAIDTGEETDLVVYDLRKLAPSVDTQDDWAMKQKEWLDQFLDAPLGRGFSSTHSLRRPDTYADMLDMMDQDLRHVFDLPKLDPMQDELPSLAAVRAHEPLLFGRHDSISEVSRRLFDQGETATVITGVSGVGKSSFLRAGLMATAWRRAPQGAGRLANATGLLMDPDLLAPPTLGDAVQIAELARPLKVLAEALTGPVEGYFRAQANENESSQVGPIPKPIEGIRPPPEPGPDRINNFETALKWWQDATKDHEGPIVLVIDQAERIVAQMLAAAELKAEREGLNPEDVPVTLSSGWAMFLDLICRLSGLDGATPDPRFRLVIAVHRLSALDLWPILRAGDQIILPEVTQIDPIKDKSDWSALIEKTIAAYGLTIETKLLDQMANEANALADEAIDLAASMPNDARAQSIAATSVLPQVKVALQLLLKSWRALSERPDQLTQNTFGHQIDIRSAINTLGEQAWDEWLPKVQTETGIDPRGYLEKRALDAEMVRRFDALMRGLVDARPNAGTVELAAISRQGRFALSAGELIPVLRDYRLLTGAGADAWRLPHRTALANWRRGIDFIRANETRISLKAKTPFANLSALPDPWWDEHEEALVDLALNWVGNRDGQDLEQYEILWAALLDRFNPAGLDVRSTRTLQRLPFALMAAGQSAKSTHFFEKTIAVARDDQAALGALLIAASESGVSTLVGLALQVGADKNFTDQVTGTFPLLMAAQEGHTEVVAALIAADADVDAVNKDNGTFPLLMAAQQGHTEVVAALIAADADVNAVNKDNGTFPLLQAAQEGHTEVVAALIAADADVNKAHETSGTTPFIAALSTQKFACALILLQKGANVPDELNLSREALEAQLEEILNRSEPTPKSEVTEASDQVLLIDQPIPGEWSDVDMNDPNVEELLRALLQALKGTNFNPVQPIKALETSSSGRILWLRAQLASSLREVTDILVWKADRIDPITIKAGIDLNEVLYSIGRTTNAPDLRVIETANKIAALFALTQSEEPLLPLPQTGDWPLEPGTDLPRSAYSEDSLRRWDWSPRPGGKVISFPVARGRDLLRVSVKVSDSGEVQMEGEPQCLLTDVPFLPYRHAILNGRPVGWVAGLVLETTGGGVEQLPDEVIDMFVNSKEYADYLDQMKEATGLDASILGEDQKRQLARQLLLEMQRLQSEQE